MFSQPTKALKVCKSVTGEKARGLTTCILPTGCFAILPLFALGRHFFALTHVSWQVGWRFPGCLVLTQVKSLKIPKYQFPPFLQQSLGLNQNSNQERTYSKQKSRTENRLAIGNKGYLHPAQMGLTCLKIPSLLSLSQLSLSLVMSVNNWRC